jgi:hypothetical protein
MFKDWLAERLSQDYPLFQGRDGAAEAATLVTSNRIAVILDGLDEISEDLRPVALRELSEQASFRVVVLGRSDETVAAAHKEFLSAAVALEMQDVDAVTAADYLTSVQRDPPPAGWAELTGHLRSMPDSPVAKALSSPLTLTLVRDTYREGDDVRELLDFCAAGAHFSRADIEDHLLDRILPAAYRARARERGGYDLPAAERALSRIAKRMNEDGTYDLAWWQIPAWMSFAPRSIAAVFLMDLMSAFAFGLSAGLIRVGYLPWDTEGRRPADSELRNVSVPNRLQALQITRFGVPCGRPSPRSCHAQGKGAVARPGRAGQRRPFHHRVRGGFLVPGDGRGFR